MKLDKIVDYYGSVIQHGEYNDRVYIIKINPDKYKETLIEAEKLAQKNNYGKIFAKVPFSLGNIFEENDYHLEATVPEFFKNGEECLFFAKYFKDEKMEDLQEEDNENNLERAFNSTLRNNEKEELSDSKISIASEKDAGKISELLGEVFTTYPFPVFNKEYILKTMKDNVKYYCYYDEDTLVGVSSSEKDSVNKNAEMTDFAVKEEYRGKRISSALLRKMEEDLVEEGYKVLYTIARAASLGANVIFAKKGYVFSGKLINNTNISGNIESMNVWYKKI